MPPAALQVQSTQLDQSGRPVVEPGAFLCDGNVALRINSWNSLIGVTITLRMRFLNSEGQVVDNTFDHTPNTNRTKSTSDFPLGIGFPLNIIAFASAGLPLIGQTFVQVQLVRGVGGASLPMASLLQDYVTSVQTLSFPGSPIRVSTESDGVWRSIVGTNPAPGVELLEVVPAGARWELRVFNATLVTSAVVVTRIPRLLIDDGGNNFFSIPSTQTEAASLSASHQWASNTPYTGPVNTLATPGAIPGGLVLMAGWRIRTATVSLDPGDDWGSPVYLVREVLELGS